MMFGFKQDLTDDELMKKIASGDNKSFEVIFNRHSGRVLGYATKLLNNQKLAEEITQEVWIKVVTLAQNYQASGHFIAWMFTMVRNASLNEIRKNKKFDHGVSLDDESQSFELPDKTDLEQNLLQSAEKQVLLTHIENLPTTQRLVLMAWMTEDLSYEEIAQSLSLTESAVKSLLFRAKKQLQDSIEGA